VRWLIRLSVCAVVATAAPTAADTLAEVLRTSGVTPPKTLVDLDRPLASHVVAADGSALIVLYDRGAAGGPPELVLLRLGPGGVPPRRVQVVWPRSAPDGLDARTCARIDSLDRRAGALVATAHVNPSASCTLVFGPDLRLRAVLPGWPVATLPDGRLVYHGNQVHFASVHPLALRLFDPSRVIDAPLHPRKPYRVIRLGHIARMRQVYTPAWCAARNHPCDPEVFDERLTGDVRFDSRGDAIAFVVSFDNTAGWSDADRWGRLEPFREIRAASGSWDRRGMPPPVLADGLAAGLSRARNLGAEAHVSTALASDPDVRDLVLAVLAALPAPPADRTRWLATLDPRWNEPEIWVRLLRLVDGPDELTEVVYVYTGLTSPGPPRYRELAKSDFDARFGSLEAALEPAALRALVGTVGR
jgi:hypothetical protein